MRRILVVLTVVAMAMAGLAGPAAAAGKGAGNGAPAERSAKKEKAPATKKAEQAAAQADSVDLLLTTETMDRDAVVAAVEGLGGTVRHVFRYAPGLAVTVPSSAFTELRAIPGVARIAADVPRYLAAPKPDAPKGGQGKAGAEPAGPTRDAVSALDESLAGAAVPLDGDYTPVSLDPTAIDPTTYWTWVDMNAAPVWNEGNLGQGSLIAVIDTGVYADHFMLAGRVIEGPDLSTDAGTEFEGSTRIDNHYHGTHVAGIAAGSGAIAVPADDLLALSIEMHAGITLETIEIDGETYKIIPLLGMAPSADVYAIKVFDHTGGSASESRIIAAIEHAIEMKELYDATDGAEGFDIDVINMSLGGWTGFDGRDLEDMTVDAATAAGITVVSAASNDGPYSMTINSPGTANTSITAGAIASPVNTRVFWDFNFEFLGIGDVLYPSDDPQVIYFSSRGPTADGRDKPTASAIGVFVLSAATGSPFALTFASGTSMATPGIAGLAALLNTAGEAKGATPYDYKEAIVAGAKPVPGFDELDQGAGLIDAAASLAALEADKKIGSPHPKLRNGYPARVVKPKGRSIQSATSTVGTTFDVELAPGMSEHYYFQLPPNAEKVVVEVSNVDLGTDPILFNSFEVYIQGGVRDTNQAYVDSTNVYGDARFVIEDLSTTASGDIFGAFLEDRPLMPGYWKLVVENDWTSFDTVTGTFHVQVVTGNAADKPDETYSGSLADGDYTEWFEVGHGPNGVDLELSWKNDYERYSTSDMDLIVAWFDTEGNLNYELSGATIHAPEIARIDATNIDQVLVLVDAFGTYGRTENWTLDVRYR